MQKSTTFFSSKVLILKFVALCYNLLISFSATVCYVFYFARCRLYLICVWKLEISSRFRKKSCNILKIEFEKKREMRLMWCSEVDWQLKVTIAWHRPLYSTVSSLKPAFLMWLTLFLSSHITVRLTHVWYALTEKSTDMDGPVSTTFINYQVEGSCLRRITLKLIDENETES